MNVCVTGALGFVGKALCDVLESRGHRLVRVVRHALTSRDVAVGEIGPSTDWRFALTSDSSSRGAGQSVDTVVHLAARVHIMSDEAEDPLAEFRRVNVDGTRNLALQAAAAGVKRFVYLSSIKVNGESTWLDRPFMVSDEPAPKDPYGISKYEAEQALQQISAQTGMEVVIIRPPLIYGPGVTGNFLLMMRWLDRGIPLPLGSTHNKRSLVGLYNLIDFIVTCINHPAAANQIFLVADSEELSTTELLQRLANAMNRPARLIPVPAKLLELGAKLLGKRGIAQRLCGSLQVDISEAHEVLGWTPPISVDEGLKGAAAGFRQSL